MGTCDSRVVLCELDCMPPGSEAWMATLYYHIWRFFAGSFESLSLYQLLMLTSRRLILRGSVLHKKPETLYEGFQEENPQYTTQNNT